MTLGEAETKAKQDTSLSSRSLQPSQPTVFLVDRDDGRIEVKCRECGKILDIVPNPRVAFCRARQYLRHVEDH